jgi:hypothetical protein
VAAVPQVPRTRLLLNDPGLNVLIKMCKKLRGYSDEYQRERRMEAGVMLANVITRCVCSLGVHSTFPECSLIVP